MRIQEIGENLEFYSFVTSLSSKTGIGVHAVRNKQQNLQRKTYCLASIWKATEEKKQQEILR
jgi:hypothetical protein